MSDAVILRGVRTHNLKNFDCEIPHHRLTAVTGVSGSGKSSLAFDTLYSEGRRRYTESLSTYARQFLQRMSRPPIDAIHNIQPAVALKQKNEVSNGRSTVGTVTEIDDHLHLMFSHAGTTYCDTCQTPVYRDDPARVAEELVEFDEGTRLVIVAVVDAPKQEHRGTLLEQLLSEGYRRLYLERETVDVTERGIEELLDRSTYPVIIDRLVIREGDEMRIAEAVEAGLAVGGGKILVYEYDSDAEPMTFDQAFRCNGCGTDFVEPQPPLFSFNSSLGACETCSGFGKTMGVDYKKVIPNPGLSLEEGAIACFQSGKYKRQQRTLLTKCRDRGIPTDVPVEELDQKQRDFIRYGGDGYTGISGFFDRLKSKQYKTHVRIFLARYRGYERCQDCRGTRLSEPARRVRFDDHLVSDFWSMRIEEARQYFDNLDIDPKVEAKVEPLLEEIIHRLHYLDEIGLGYLELGRQARTLSGGEMQRIDLTSSLGRALTDTLYVLDEPTAGLHARDSRRLLNVLEGLRDVGNTVVVVEHDPEIILGADHIVELGPVGGEQGGSLTYDGPRDDYELDEDVDFTRAQKMAGDTRGEPSPGSVQISGARQHNLKDIDVEFPKRRLSVVTGVSGSGKSTLMEDVLYNGWRRLQGEGGVDAGDFDELHGLGEFDSVELMDQSSIGRSSRSNAMSYTKAFDNIRKCFAKTDAAHEAGLTVGDFSFNTPGGRCADCEGTGTITVEMHFMADVDVPCETCDGKRYGPEVLGIRYRGKNISDVFEMTVDEAAVFFEDSRAIQRKLKPLQEVGLGYLRLGQTTDTYSGGEAQRLKLATYIADGRKRGETEPILFIFDEPTIGLHLHDISVLLVALRKLVELGHTVICVEHNIDFIAYCDHVVDLGPGAGPRGGEVIATGAMEDIAQTDESVTGGFLAEFLAS